MRRQVKATGTRLILGMDDVERAAASYARLGLRVLERSGRRAVVELPCGIRLVLTGARPVSQ